MCLKYAINKSCIIRAGTTCTVHAFSRTVQPGLPSEELHSTFYVRSRCARSLFSNIALAETEIRECKDLLKAIFSTTGFIVYIVQLE